MFYLFFVILHEMGLLPKIFNLFCMLVLFYLMCFCYCIDVWSFLLHSTSKMQFCCKKHSNTNCFSKFLRSRHSFFLSSSKTIWFAAPGGVVLNRLQLLVGPSYIVCSSWWDHATSSAALGGAVLHRLRKPHLEAGPGLEHFPLLMISEKLIWRLDLAWSIFI